MTQDEQAEPGHWDLDAPLVLSVVTGGAILLFVLVTLLRAFVYDAMAGEHGRKVVDQRYLALEDNRIEQRIQLSEHGINDDGRTRRIPIEAAMRLYVEQYAAAHPAPRP